VLVGLACGAFTFAFQTRHPEVLAYDWTRHLRAGRALLAGQNPYAVIRAIGPYPFNHAYYYPLPAAFLGVPVANLIPALSSAVAVGACSVVLAFAVTRNAWHRSRSG
jgi:hypothetical protein